MSAKQLAIQQQVAKTVLKTTAGLKQATRDIAKTIVKQDITKVKSIGAVRTGVTTTISPAEVSQLEKLKD